MNGAALFFACCIDAFLGDPRFTLHPVRLMGQSASAVEGLLRRRSEPGVIAGGFGVLALLILWLFPAVLLFRLLRSFPAGYLVLATVVVYFTISLRDLFDHAWRVRRALVDGEEGEARRLAGLMVSRDTEELDREGIILSTVESVAENISDGVVGILVYSLLFGPVGALGFRLINTLDAMWGYRTAEYLRFGRTAARLDDLAGWIPARLSALALVAAAWLTGNNGAAAWAILIRDAGKHASPNSGRPEAAVAGALGIRFGGRLSYHGKTVVKPYIGDKPGTPVDENLILAAILLTGTAALLLLGALCAVWFFVFRIFFW